MINLKTYGYTEIEAIPDGLLPGRVTELRRERFTVMTERGEVTAVLKGAFYHSVETRVDFPCVGDFVLLRYNESGDSLIVTVLPRRSKFSRADYSGHAVGYAKTVREQVVATNFDYVFILSSLNWDFNITRLMRYLTQVRQSGSQPVVILTKADLVEDYNLPLAEVTQSIPDVPVHAICSHTGLGLNELAPYLMPGKTVVFLGMSGVGKSSLLNALIEQDVMRVQAIREVDSRGRHTTTHRQLFMLPSGTMVIDTPGMRELGLLMPAKAYVQALPMWRNGSRNAGLQIAAIRASRAVPFSPRLPTVLCRVNGGSIMLPSSMSTSMSRIKQATSSTRGLEIKR